ncbi:MAG: efflux RND transporter periplasmic adaptor subunit, partial [Phycisphaeraceae bacterium]|nr:efflux RND transporter periplasmic adaptor subunit [Phycisphaeraceae bacterium]
MNDQTHRNDFRGWAPVLVISLVAISAFVLGWWWAAGAAETDGDSTETAATQPTQMYTCAMHPHVRLPDPEAPCPICGMELIPVSGNEPTADAGQTPHLRVSERSAALMQVRVQPAVRQPATVAVPFYGKVGFDETRVRDVNLKVAGWIETLHIDFEGEAVAAGDPLFDLYSPELYTAQREYLIAHRRQGESGDDLLDAARTRLRFFGVTDAQIEALAERGEATKTMTIHSPHDGVVIERGAFEGMKVEPGTRLYRLADLSQVWVQLEAYERDLPWLAVGQRARVNVEGRPGEKIAGEVTFIDPTVDPQKRTAQVRLAVENPQRTLKPGMFVRGLVQAKTEKSVLVVPASAPLVTGERALVYVQLPDTEWPTYQPREVVLGPKAGEWWVVREGIR